MQLVIGNRNYSSWSLRGWLLARRSDLPFETLRVPLFQAGSAERLAKLSPTGKVPVLHDGGLCVWESLAIAEYLAERAPHLWPADPAARAVARSACAEMHAGFQALRQELPMNVRRRPAALALSEACQADVRRIQALWRECRRVRALDGPWLFGEYCAADAFFAPVALRLHGYEVPIDEDAAAYVATQRADPLLREWCAQAVDEPETIAGAEIG